LKDATNEVMYFSVQHPPEQISTDENPHP
jgi:hypothetical protein